MTAESAPHGLLIEAELTVELPDSTIELHSEADTLYLDAPSFGALRELRTTAGSEAVDWLRRQAISAPLTVATPLVVRVHGVAVARYEPATPPGRLADWLGIPLRVDPGGVLRAAVQRLSN